jgi:PAS domain S-box-containing protein
MPNVDFLAAIIDHVAHPIFVKDRQFRWVLLNRALCEMVGYPREELLGKTDYDFFPRAEADFFRQKDIEMFTTGSQVTIDEEPITDAAGRRHVLATTKVPLRAESGEVTHLVGIVHDITRLKAAEEALRLANEELELRVCERTAALEAAQAELVRKERMAVLGQLAGSLAHEIRNPLAAINNAASVLEKTVGRALDPAEEMMIPIIFQEVRKANRIITGLVDYARMRPAVRRAAGLLAIVEQALLWQTVPDGVRVEVALGTPPAVLVDPEQTLSAISNLAHNALEAMPDGGTLTLRARQDGKEVVLSITDTGSGIPRAMRGRLFQPLETTKKPGLGLGLTTTRALIENQGGSITWESLSGAGTRFDVRLPVAPEAPAQGADPRIDPA